jgi:hypothetical protein
MRKLFLRVLNHEGKNIDLYEVVCCKPHVWFITEMVPSCTEYFTLSTKVGYITFSEIQIKIPSPASILSSGGRGRRNTYIYVGFVS